MLQCKLRNLVFGVEISWPRGKYLLASIYIHICKMEPLGKLKSHKQVVSEIRYNNFDTKNTYFRRWLASCGNHKFRLFDYNLYLYH